MLHCAAHVTPCHSCYATHATACLLTQFVTGSPTIVQGLLRANGWKLLVGTLYISILELCAHLNPMYSSELQPSLRVRSTNEQIPSLTPTLLCLRQNWQCRMAGVLFFFNSFVRPFLFSFIFNSSLPSLQLYGLAHS